MNNFDDLVYTYKHRKIVMFLANLYFDNDELFEQLKKHDMDKMYLLLFYEKKSINKFHRSISSHHDNELPKTELDYIEMVLDWESARYTKDDKPLNAYDTMNKFYPNLKDKILPILEKMGLDYSTTEKDKRVVEYRNTIDKITTEDIKKELIDYINNSFPNNKVKQKTRENSR